MSISIARRNLTKSEISGLVNDIRLYPNLAYVSPTRFRHLSEPYCVSVDGRFAGICGIYSFDTWIKLGPLVLLHRFLGQGVGRKLLDKIITDHKKTSIYIASSNPAVQHIITSHGFKQIPSYFQLPNNVKLFLLRQLVEHLNLNFLKEGLRKKFFQRRGEIQFYVRLAQVLIPPLLVAEALTKATCQSQAKLNLILPSYSYFSPYLPFSA